MHGLTLGSSWTNSNNWVMKARYILGCDRVANGHDDELWRSDAWWWIRNHVYVLSRPTWLNHARACPQYSGSQRSDLEGINHVNTLSPPSILRSLLPILHKVDKFAFATANSFLFNTLGLSMTPLNNPSAASLLPWLIFKAARFIT